MVEKNKVYRHFKGNLYLVIDVAKHSETEEDYVVYKEINSDKLWIRPLAMFIEKVDKVKYPTVTQEYRFERVD